MKVQYLIFCIVLIIAFIVFIRSKLKTRQQQAPDVIQQSSEDSGDNRITNDKLVIVEDAGEEDISKMVRDFCKDYNKKANKVIPFVTKIADRKFAITFPYDIDFELFCFLVNYMNYPQGFNRRFKAIGWSTAKPSDTWITEQSANKPVMLFVSDTDNEYDNVMLTTADNIGYKLGFAMGEEKQRLSRPDKLYTQPPVTQQGLAN